MEWQLTSFQTPISLSRIAGPFVWAEAKEVREIPTMAFLLFIGLYHYHSRKRRCTMLPMKPIATIAVIALAVGLSGCVPPPKEGGEAETKKSTEHQTAGLTGEVSNGKVDETMEGSGNLGWQGSYEREKRARVKAQP